MNLHLQQIFLSVMLLLSACVKTPDQKDTELHPLLQDLPSIAGTTNYLKSPYVTAGDRLYAVGYQDGSFPELGWHIPGEMGGVWSHPIKLLDGFSMEIHREGESPIDKGEHRFINYPMANKMTWELKSTEIPLSIERVQFVPDGYPVFLVEYTFQNTGLSELKLRVNFKAFSDLRPTWLGEETGMIDSTDQGYFNESSGFWDVQDSKNPWFLCVGSDQKPEWTQPLTDNTYQGNGAAMQLTYVMHLEPDTTRTLRFAISGSTISQLDAENSAREVLNNASRYFKQKSDRYNELELRSKLTIPDTLIQETFEWLKYNADWMVRHVPGIGVGISAGIPDYPWWFGADSEYALKGYMAVGQSKPALSTIHLLDSISNAVNGNGRIIHEVSTNGKVYNPGNVNETAQFASLIWDVFRWTGNRDFLLKYFPTVRNGLDWLINEKDTDGNGFPDGFGMMEIHGMDSEMIDVAAYTCRAFSDAALMAETLGNNELALTYQKTAQILKKKINRDFWSSSFGSFADFRGTEVQALRLIDAALVRADTLKKPWATEELKKTRSSILNRSSKGVSPFVLHHNWVVNTPMEMGIADWEKAIIGLNTAQKYTNPFGVFVTGIDGDESAGLDFGSFKGGTVFSYTGAVMTLPTGVLAVAENNYRRPDQALDYLRRMSRTFSFALPGSMYEVSPDYGMISQAWNLYGFAVPIVNQFFGITPRADLKKVTISPKMPSSWDFANLENVIIADNAISVYFNRTSEGKIRLKVVQTNPEYVLEIPDTELNSDLKIISGKRIKTSEGSESVLADGSVLEIIYSETER